MLNTMDTNYNFALADPFLNMEMTSTVYAQPVERIEEVGIDLAAVKQEPLDTGYYQHDAYMNVVDVKTEPASPGASTPAPAPVRPQKGKRGRKPQITAYVS